MNFKKINDQVLCKSRKNPYISVIFIGIIFFFSLGLSLFFPDKYDYFHEKKKHRDKNHSSALYNPFWKIGNLDPVRHHEWSEHHPGEVRLEHVKVDPVSVVYIAEGDTNNPSDYNHFEAIHDPEGGITITPVRGQKNITMFIDFGRVIPGTVELVADPPSQVTLIFQTGEALQPTRTYGAMDLPDGKKKTFRPNIVQGGWGGMRFIWIHFHNVTDLFKVYDLYGLLQIYPCPYIGSFECSDKELSRIWEMCAYSAHAVMGQPVGSDPKPKPVLQTLCLDRVDRKPWAGDHRVIQSVVVCVFGEYPLIRNALESLLPTGQRPIPDLQGIPPYTLDWGLALIDYFYMSGDQCFLSKRIKDLNAIIEKYKKPNSKGWFFFDWDHRIDSVSKEARIVAQRSTAFLGKYIQLCLEASRASYKLGKPELAETFLHNAEECMKIWRSENRNWQNRYDLHAVTNLILGQVLIEKDYQRAYDCFYSDRLKRCPGTPYFGIYVLDALALMGRYDEAVEMLHDYWGTMITAGATTTWEEWHPAWRMAPNSQPPQYGPPSTWGGLSLVQPAGAGPARWMLNHILGISAEEPGFRCVHIKPFYSNLEWARGSIATPLGKVKVNWENDEKYFALEFYVPKKCDGVTTEVPISQYYWLDRKPIEPQMIKRNSAIFRIGSGHHTLDCQK
jgi:hypothetical protein